MSKLFDRIKQIVREATLNPSMAGQRAPAVIPQHAGPRQAGSPNTGRPRPTRSTPPRVAPVIKPKPTPSINDRGRVGNDYAGEKPSGLKPASLANFPERVSPAKRDTTPVQKQNGPFRAKVAPNRPGFNSTAERPKTNTPVNVAPRGPVQANITGKGDLQGGGTPQVAPKANRLDTSSRGKGPIEAGKVVKPTQVVKPQAKPAVQAGAKVRKPQAGGKRTGAATVSNKASKAPKIQPATVKTNFVGGFGQKGVSRFDSKRTNK